MLYALAVTSQSIDVEIYDDSGLAVTGLIASTFPTLTYSLAGANADVAFPALSDLSTITTAYASGGVKERGNGVYRLDVPNGVFTTAGKVTIRGDASGKHMIAVVMEVQPKVDVDTVKTQSITCSAGITVGAFVGQATAAIGVNASGHVSRVTLVDTITTYTGDTPQTGDSFARLGAPAGASVSADIAGVPTTVWAAGTRTLTAFAFSVTVGTNNDKTGYSLTVTPPTATEVAEATLKADWSTITGEAARSLLNANRKLRNKWSISGATLTVYKEDGTTPAFTETLATTAGAEPITSITP